MSIFETQPLFLIGMMGVGKSTVGSLVAIKLGRRFIDLDAVIEQDAGATIAELWQSEGEGAFRAREAEVLRRVAGDGPQVIALGGGTPCTDANAELIGRVGKVVWLTAPTQDLVARIGDPKTRPLLAASRNPAAEIDRLMMARQKYYARAHLVVETAGLPPSKIAAKIVEESGAWE